MKTRSNPFLRLIALATFAIAMNQAHAATNVWVGDTDNSFIEPLNWTGDAFPNPATDIMRFDGPGAQGNATITNATVALSNSGTSAGTNLGQILFSGSSPAMTLSGGTISLPAGTHNNAIVLSAGSTVTQTIGSNILIGDGSAATSSFVNASTTGGLLKITGNITGGTGAVTPGTVALSFGNTATHNGNYEVTGNIIPGGAANEFVTLTKRGTGTLTLSGNNTLGNGLGAALGSNESNSTIRINGGTTAINNGADNHWGGTNSAALTKYQISSGIVNAQSARYLRASLLIDGGTLNIGTVGGSTGRLSFDVTTPDKTFTMTSGAVNFLSDVNNINNVGIRFGGDSGPAAAGGYSFVGTQSGGNFTVHGRGANSQTFSLGSTTASAVSSYSLSGGTLDVVGDLLAGVPRYFGNINIGADAAGTGSSTFTLSGSGKLIVRSVAANGLGIQGSQVGAVQNFDVTGGTLVAGEITTANLRATGDLANGTFTNKGGNIAPGDVGSSGLSTVTGNITVNSGTLSIDIGGTAASTVFQDAAATGKHDKLVVAGGGAAVLGGNLSVSLIDGFTPLNTDTFTIITGGSVSGTFSNLSAGKVTLTGGGTFDVTVNAASVVLSNYTAGAGNVAPTITDIANQSVPSGGATSALAFTVGDETPGTVIPSGTSSNLTLVPNGNIVFGGSGANRTVTVTPVSGLTGTATITVTLTDAGSLTATDTFVLTVTDNYLSWSTANGVTGGPNGDSDNDGVSNLVEYGLVNGGERGVYSGNAITFSKRGTPYDSDVTYAIETSTDLGIAIPWSVAVSGVTENSSSITYTFTPGTPVKNFARLKVTKAP